MNQPEPKSRSVTARREPPPFRRLAVVRTTRRSDRMVRITLGGRELEGLEIGEPAASIRLLLPTPGSAELVIPEWNGNEFLMADQSRPTIRTFTPRRLDQTAGELDVDMVIHEGGVASHWATAASIGDAVAVSGPGRGYTVDPTASGFLLAGDETAIPAMSQLVEAIPHNVPIQVHVELSSPVARQVMPPHPRLTVDWHEQGPLSHPGDELVAVIKDSPLESGTRIWCAGEAAAMHRIRTELFKERQIPRRQAVVRGYWKRDRETD